MTDQDLQEHQHEHTFGQDEKKEGESQTVIVIAITALMMVVEIVAGLAYGSMALLADGLHMASHASALAIAAFAYIYARRHAANPRFSFGTGKVNALGGFSGAILLACFSALMAYESVVRLLHPQTIAFDQAIGVAILGLLVNGACALVLGHNGDHHHGHDHNHHSPEHQHDHEHHHDHGHDHNLRSAYLHVMADALTSITAIAALLAAKFFGWIWMDPVMGIAGSILVASWSIGLIRTTAATLLDHQAPEKALDATRAGLESDGEVRVTDLHLWAIGPGVYSAVVALVADQPLSPETYKARIPKELGVEHATIEIHARTEEGARRAKPSQ